jgi:hypothetical protein
MKFYLSNLRVDARKLMSASALIALSIGIGSNLLLYSLQLLSPSPEVHAPSRLPDMAKLPISFEPNFGQTDSSARFLVHSNGNIFFFAPSEVVLTYQIPTSETVNTPESRVQIDKAVSAPPNSEHGVLRLRFIGSASGTSITGGSELPGKVNYLLGEDPSTWLTNLPTYSGITYSNLYAGIDLSYTDSGGQLKGTYAVSPGADPSVIRWQHHGANKVEVDERGNLQVYLTGVGEQATKLTEAAPIAWQEINGRRITVDTRYAVASNGVVGFELGYYDVAHPLTIDPALTYSTYLGGSSLDEAYGVAVDSAYNVYLTGRTASTDFPLEDPRYPNYGGDKDAFVTKLNSAGTVLEFSTYLGGSKEDGGYAIALDSNGSAYVTGYTYSTNFPHTIDWASPEKVETRNVMNS